MWRDCVVVDYFLVFCWECSTVDLICSINLDLILCSRAIVLAKLEMIARDVRARVPRYTFEVFYARAPPRARVCHRFISRADNLR